MQTKKMAQLVVAFAFFMIGCAQAATPLSPEELKKQNEFKKAYDNPGKKDRVEAVHMLDGCTHPSTISILNTVIATETFTEVKAAAFRQLSTIPVTDPALSQMLAQIFDSLKPNDFEAHLEFVPQMRNSEFKYALYEVMSDYGSKLRYPDLITNSQYGGDPNVMIKKTRAEFDKYLKAFNAVTGAGLPLQDKNSPSTLRTWWNNNRDKILAADKELLEKYRHEDIERRNKATALAGGGKEPVAKEPVEKERAPAAVEAPVAAKPAPTPAPTAAKKKPTKDDE